MNPLAESQFKKSGTCLNKVKQDRAMFKKQIIDIPTVYDMHQMKHISSSPGVFSPKSGNVDSSV